MTDVRHRLYLDSADEDEVALPSGDVTEGVVRVGGTVRRPAQPQSFAVAAFLDHLASAGFPGSPRFLGRDAKGRDVLTYLEGRCAGAVPEAWVRHEDLLVSVGQMVRRLHDAADGYDPAAEPFPPRPVRQDPPELVCHLDVTPQNVVVRGGTAVGLVDFDLAGPSTRLKDSYNTAMHWVPLRDPADLWPGWEQVDQARRLRIFADAYGWGAEERRRLPGFGAEAAVLSWERMKHNAEVLGGGWSRMWADGVGEMILRRGNWLRDNRQPLVDALLA
jgi:hypothetical protein